MVIHRAGKSKHLDPVDDPFFSSHTPCFYEGDKTAFPVYCPDHEATALGCLEQYQFCLPKSDFCTPWGYKHEQLWETKNHLEMEWEPFLVSQMWAIETAFNYSSVHQVLFKRENTEISQSMTPLTRTSPWNPDYRREKTFNRKDQWITEVETWFRKGILDSILRIQYAGRWRSGFYFQYLDTGISSYNGFMAKAKDYSPCDLILFNDTDYTNIFLVEFWLTISLLVPICIASYRIEWLLRAINTLSKRLFRPTNFLIVIFHLCTHGQLWHWVNWRSRFWLWGFVCRAFLPRRLESDRLQPRSSMQASDRSDMEHGIHSIPLETSGPD